MYTTDTLIESSTIKPGDLSRTSPKIALSEVFKSKSSRYINEFMLFVAHYNAIPNCMSKEDINCIKANQWFAENYKCQIKDHYHSKHYSEQTQKMEDHETFYFLFDDLLIYFNIDCSYINCLYRSTPIKKVEEIIQAINKKFKKRRERRKPQISLLVNSSEGIDTTSLQINKLNLNIDDNYNDDFKAIHQIILKRLSRVNDKGLVLLHGKPGTGKTSYIRYLITSLKKKVIFLPPDMASAITNPNLINVLINNPNSILVIEDAENIVADRDKGGYSPVSTLLNLSDGLMSDCLNVQIICSFNVDISKIDSALLRKGRLIANYEFKELEVEKAKHLSNKLGFKSIIEKPMTLTAIYNQEERDFHRAPKRNPIGFQPLHKFNFLEDSPF